MAADRDEAQEAVGLFQLWPLKDSDVETTLDIVAIHGLGGHPYETWMDNERLWLRDFLPISLPTARVFTFGYDSGISVQGSVSEIPDFARLLLARLRTARRKSCKSRPVIFVCHSLGGIIFKKSLVLAHEREDQYGDLLKAVKGVVFMGTPHRGAEPAYWSSLLGKVARFWWAGSSPTDLMKDLEPKSKSLGEICSQFVERGRKLQIFTFYERIKIASLEDLVVDKDSAVLHLPNETPLPMEADHLGICKFSSASSQRYQMVLSSLEDLIEECEEDKADYLSPEQSHFLDALRHTDGDIEPLSKFGQVPDAATGTCSWIMANAKFRSWALADRSKLLWIQGPAGCGKSVFVKYIVNNLPTKYRQLHPVDVGSALRNRGATVLCNNRTSVQINASTVFRCILHQVLKQKPRLSQHISQDFYADSSSASSLETLVEWLSEIILHARGLRLWIAIDALDELPDAAAAQVRHHLEKLLHADSAYRLRILVTDRRNPPVFFLKSCRALVSLNLEVEEVHRDVERYVQHLVAEFQDTFEISSALAKTIQLDVVSHSKGLFLFASLNWASFREGFSYWNKSRIMDKLRELGRLSSNFETLYCNLLRKVPEDFRPYLRKAFMLILVARQSISLGDLHFGVSILPEHTSYDDVMEDMGFNFAKVLEHHCSQFLRLNTPEAIQFRHQSVQDVLQKVSSVEEHEKLLQEFRASTASCEYLSQQICLKILEFEHPPFLPTKNDGSEEAINQTLPFLLYAIRHWPDHLSHVQDEPEVAEAAAKFLRTPNRYFFRRISYQQSSVEQRIRSLLKVNMDEKESPVHSLVHTGDFELVLKCLFLQGEDMNPRDENAMTPLHWAILLKRHRLARAFVVRYKVDPNRGPEGLDKPIHACANADFSDPEMLQLLLLSPRIDVNSRGENGRTTLHKIVRGGRSLVSWLDVLLRNENVQVNLKDDKGMTPFVLALSMTDGEDAATRLIHWRGHSLDITGTDLNGTNALSLASIRGWTETRRFILSRDRSQIYTTGDDGMNILTRVAFFGQRDMLVNLLRDLQFAEVRRLSNLGRFNLMNLCAQQDWPDIVDMLRGNFGLVSLEQDSDYGRTTLHWAAMSWSTAGPLPTERAMVNVQDFTGSTPLHLAAESRNTPIAKFLLSEGANILLKDKRGRTPVHTAAESGSCVILGLLLDTPIREYGRDNDGRSVLHYIATWEWPPVLVRFIRTKRPLVDVADKKRRTALHYAAIYGNHGVVATLINGGAGVEKRDGMGLTAALHAIRQGHIDVLHLLMKHGADIHRVDGLGRTALQIAYLARKQHMVDFLRAHGVHSLPTKDWNPHQVSDNYEYPKFRIDDTVVCCGYDPSHVTISCTESLDDKWPRDIDEIRAQILPRYFLPPSHYREPLQPSPSSKGSPTESPPTMSNDTSLDSALGTPYPSLNGQDGIPSRPPSPDHLNSPRSPPSPYPESPSSPDPFSQDPGYPLTPSPQCPPSSRPSPSLGRCHDSPLWTPLQTAVILGMEETIESLLAMPDFNAAEKCPCGGWTALHIAAHQGKVQIARKLLECSHSQSIDIESDDGTTAALIAVRYRQADFLDLCLQHGADPHKRDYEGLSAFQLAVINKDMPTLLVLERNGVSPGSPKCPTESTLLHLAASLDQEVHEFVLSRWYQRLISVFGVMMA